MITSQASRHVPILLALVPGIGMLVFVLCYGVDVPFFDQWYIAPALSDWIAGDGSLDHLWEPHNKHRFLCGLILMFGLAWLTDWNVCAELVLNVLLALGILFGLRACLPVHESGRVRWLLPLLSLFVFSLHAYMNWFHGVQITMYLSVLSLVWSLALLAPSEGGAVRLGFAAFLAVVSSYSHSSGFVVWPIGLLLLTRRPRQLLAWLAVGAVTVALHAVDLRARGELDASPDGVGHAWALFHYVCNFLGAPVVGLEREGPAFAAGLLGQVALLAAGIVVWRVPGNRTRHTLVFLALGLYAVAVAWMAAVARGPSGGTAQALSSRYVTHATFLWVSLVVLPYLLELRPGLRRSLQVIALAPCIVLVATQAASWNRAVEHHAWLTRGRTALLQGSGLSREVLSRVSPYEGQIAQVLDRLKARRLSLYRDCAPELRRLSTDINPARPTLALEMQTAPSGRRMIFRVSGGRPGNAAAIYLTRIGDQPTKTVVHLGDLDGSGAMELSLPVPGRWQGESVGFTCEAIGRCVLRVKSEEVVFRP